MKKVIINPGTGSVEDTSLDEATKNMVQFCKDVAEHICVSQEDVSFQRTKEFDYGDGRYSFLVTTPHGSQDVQMVGLPIEEVRWVDGLNPWLYPRLYVDDSSWLWEYAVHMFKIQQDREEE